MFFFYNLENAYHLRQKKKLFIIFFNENMVYIK